ncbi:hypothetical protein GALMADRAFT_220003 [Galerina marginata CBS 339.88]|uniref:Thioesterase domain-containing protein n=1 Tax=Galerina marginata (strain CBS 339.88) TaxID=685588 RepID=A0A067TLX3_GALM3|nr:hypothetical protein GALMADRAFT_220003 [Galerina marginata CBS 339.88]
MSRSSQKSHYLQSRLPDELTSGITGNAPLEIKELPLKWLAIFRNKGRGFAGSVAARLKVTDVSVVPSVDDPLKKEGKVVCDIEVTPDMCSERGVLDEGCIFFLIDECSTVAMVVINAYDGLNTPPGVSQTINTFYHNPALVGMKLRLVSTSLSSGLQTNAGRCEVWDTKNHRLVASGTQQTMPPSK